MGVPKKKRLNKKGATTIESSVAEATVLDEISYETTCTTDPSNVFSRGPKNVPRLAAQSNEMSGGGAAGGMLDTIGTKKNQLLRVFYRLQQGDEHQVKE